MISGKAGLDHAELIRLLESHGFKKKQEHEQHVAFLWAELLPNNRYERASYTVHCYLKNLIDRKQAAADKAELFFRMNDEFRRKHMANSRLLGDVDEVKDEVLIVKPVGRTAFGGRGITIVTSTQQLVHAKSQFGGTKVLVCDYVRDPFLWQGRKFHLRLYLAVAAGGQRWSLWHRGKLLTAGKPYADAQYDDKLVHDTHAESTPRNLYWPDDLGLTQEQLEHVRQQLDAVGRSIANSLKDSAPFAESARGFEVFGLDLLLRENLNVVLLEANDKVGYLPVVVQGNHQYDDGYADFSAGYFRWIFTEMIAPMMNVAVQIEH